MVIGRGVKPIKRINKNHLCYYGKCHVQREVPHSHKLLYHAYEPKDSFEQTEITPHKGRGMGKIRLENLMKVWWGGGGDKYFRPSDRRGSSKF